MAARLPSVVRCEASDMERGCCEVQVEIIASHLAGLEVEDEG
jgi:hypothetical protein